MRPFACHYVTFVSQWNVHFEFPNTQIHTYINNYIKILKTMQIPKMPLKYKFSLKYTFASLIMVENICRMYLLKILTETY